MTEAEVERVARSALRRLAESRAMLLYRPDVNTCPIVRPAAGDHLVTLARIDRAMAEEFARRGWISGSVGPKLTRYRITAAGIQRLGDLLEGPGRGFEHLRQVINPATGEPYLSAVEVIAGNLIRDLWQQGFGRRVTALLAPLDPTAREVVRLLCCEDLGVGTIEKRLGLGRGAAKFILRTALASIGR